MTTLEPRVSLVKPGTELATRQDDDLEIRHRGWLATRQGEPRQVVELVTRARQATARQLVWVADQPLVAKSAAVTRQLPKAGGLLVVGTPRGGARLATMLADWLRDAQSAELLAKHADAGEGESWTKVSAERRATNLPRRRALVGMVAGLLVLVGLAWWAPHIFAGILAIATFAGTIAMAPRSDLKEWGYGAAIATLLASLAWWQGPFLASQVPQPPAWVWWCLAGALVAVCAWVGREPDRPLVVTPATLAPLKPPPITATLIVEALFRIGVPGMGLVAAGKGMRDEIQVRAPGVGRAKHGWQIELELPPGITAGDVAKQREELAGALRRPLGCVWPSGGGDHPGHLRIYMGDKPMATAQQAEWPLAAGCPIDIFDPFPLFTDEEGRWVNVTLLGTHAVVAGASGFGKSVTLRQLGTACVLDPRVRAVVLDGKISGDLAPLQKVAHAYYEGAEPEDVVTTLEALQGIETEMRRRARFLRDLPPEERSPKVTSALASRYPDLSPIVVLIDEVQEYTEYGVKGSKEDKYIRESFIASLTRISRLGRSAGIAMVLVSQKPEASVIPTAIMGNCAIRVCHKVTEQNHNDQVMGTSAYKNGYNAALFSQEDRGLAWLRAEGDPQVVRSWSAMVELEPAIDLVDKAYAMRKARGLLTGQAADDGIEDAEIVYDIVEDAERAMHQSGSGKAQWGELIKMLHALRPMQYADLSEKELSAAIYRARPALRAAGGRDVRSGGSNRKGVYISDLRKHDARTMMFDSPLHDGLSQVSASRTVSRGRRGAATPEPSATPATSSDPTDLVTEEGFGHADEVIEWKRRWLLSKKSERTRETYDRDLNRWLAHCAATGVAVWLAEPHDVDEYRNTLVGAPASVARQIAAVSSFYRLVLRRARPCPIVANPAADVERPRVDTASHRDGLDKAGAMALRAAAIDHSPRTAALVHLLLGTAMRVSEAVSATTAGLGWNEVGERTLQVVRKGGRPDTIVIEPADWLVIDRYLSGRPDVPEGWLFATTGGRRMTRQTAYRLVRQVADTVTGPSKKVGPHSIRHTAATLALDAGVPVQEVQGMLRHASAATTQRYDRSSRERGRVASRAIAELWDNTNG